MFKSWARVQTLERKIIGLESERVHLKEEVEDLKLKKKIEDEDIKHMVKIKQEQLNIEHQKKVIELEREKEKAIAAVKDQYRDKTEARLEQETKNIKSMYSEILARLPDINVKLQGKIE